MENKKGLLIITTISMLILLTVAILFPVSYTHLDVYKRQRMGYGTVTEAAVPPLEAKHTHEEIMAIPNIDITPLPLFGNNWFVLQWAKEGKIDEIAAFVASWLRIVKGYGIKIVNPCGTEAWGWGGNVHGLSLIHI